MGAEGDRIFNKEFVSAVATTSLVFLAAALIPLLGPLMGLFIPLPVFIFTYKLNRFKGAVVFLLSLLVVSVPLHFLGFSANLALLLLLGTFGFLLSEIFRRGLSIEKTAFHASFTLLTMGLLFLVFHFLVAGENPMRLIASYISEGVQESISVYAQLGVPAEQISEIRKNAPLIVRAILSLAPALAVIGAVSFALLNILAGRAIMLRTGVTPPDFGDLTYWKIPDQMVWFVILAGGLILVPIGDVRVVGLNLLIIFLFFYLFQGFAIISHFFQRKNVPLFFRGLVYFLIFAQNILFLFVIMLGFSDIWLNFRKIGLPRDESRDDPSSLMP